jgi:hypothetical protein
VWVRSRVTADYSDKMAKILLAVKIMKAGKTGFQDDWGNSFRGGLCGNRSPTSARIAEDRKGWQGETTEASKPPAV